MSKIKNYILYAYYTFNLDLWQPLVFKLAHKFAPAYAARRKYASLRKLK